MRLGGDGLSCQSQATAVAILPNVIQKFLTDLHIMNKFLLCLSMIFLGLALTWQFAILIK